MESIMGYIFLQPFPWTWLVQDIVALGLMVYVVICIYKREDHPVQKLLEVVAFIFLYASIYENAAIVMGLYSYGRSLVMIGFVPASVPIIEACVLVIGFWFLEKTKVPAWAKPPIIGLFGMLQDFSLDPLAVRQVYTTAGVTSGRWNWLIDPSNYPNILNIPVFNFSGWMLIMLYGSATILIGRWWYKKAHFNKVVGIVYPFLSMIAAFLLMISPVSNFLLWLQPVFAKGQSIEWVMLVFHLTLPVLLLWLFWHGRNSAPYDVKDWPIFVIPTLLHLSDVAFTLIGGFTEILWIVLLACFVQTAFLIFAFLNNRSL